jgi:hypothetical protein
VIWYLKEWHLLPEAWLYGLAFVLNFARARGAFMSGDYSLTGWVTFFPFALVVKSTLPMLLLMAGGGIAAIGTFARARLNKEIGPLLLRTRPFLPLAVLFVVYWATSLTSHLNIGHRHILPTYPVMFIAAGWLGRFIDVRRQLAASCIIGATLWHVGESFRARPHYLAYFNQLVGGSENGWRHLVDSSLDWGQELSNLAQWLEVHARGERVFLSYFGTGDPTYEGIKATILPTLPEVGPHRPWHALAPGTYAISATMLQHVYSKVRGPWTMELEREYQQLRSLEPELLAYEHDLVRRKALLQDAPAENWKIAWKRYEQLRFARLCHYLRVRRPDAVIGHAIFVHRLNATELRGATGDSVKDWRALIEQAVAQRNPAAD